MAKKIVAAAKVIKEHKMSLLVLALFLVLAAGARMQSLDAAETFHGIVEREEADGNTETQSFWFHLETEADAKDPLAEEVGEQELALDVAPQQLAAEEAFALLEEAAAEWEERYLGENVSAGEVRRDLVLPATFCDGMVAADYESSDYEVLTAEGVVETGALSAEGELVELTARFSCGEYTRLETVSLQILPTEEGSAEWVIEELEKEAEQAEESSREQGTFSLPEAIGGYQVIWDLEEDHAWIYFILLGAVAVCCLEWRGRQQEKQRQKKRMAQLELEYPQMVDQFAVLLESGMSIRKAWERILIGARRTGSGGNKKNREGSAYLEEMWITYREMREGRGEREAYERFGNRIGLMPYKRFSSLLTQNLSKGTRDVKELLQKEAAEALEERKSRARRQGEEAGTKLLFPMMVMLLLILLILLLPALTNL